MKRDRKGGPAEKRGPSQRQLRIGEELRHVLAQVLARGELRDPALAHANVTVTEVRVSPDLSNATVYVVPLGGTDSEAIVEALNHAQGFLRTALAHELDLRRTPHLRFAVDRTFDEAGRVREILARPRVRRDIETAPNGAAEDGEA
jgi:ribosome-binding factor A